MLKKELTIEEIKEVSKENAEEKAKTMKNPVIIPVYVAIDIDAHTNKPIQISGADINFILGNRIITN